jgi:hypothetical protein
MPYLRQEQEAANCRSWLRTSTSKDIRFEGEMIPHPIDLSPSIVRDPNKCVLCRRCVSMCKNVQKVGVIDTNERGFKTIVGFGVRKAAGGSSLHQLRSVHKRLPGGSAERKRRYRQGVGSAGEQGHPCGSSDSSRCKGRSWRRIRDAVGTRVTSNMIAR